MSMHIIDRRPTPDGVSTGGKSLANRQRFLRRMEVDKSDLDFGSIASDGSIVVKRKAGNPADEPTFHRKSTGGVRDYLLPGNKEYIAGDTIKRPPSGGGGQGSQGSPGGEGEDEFKFNLSRDEFANLFLNDLELPDLKKKTAVNADSTQWRRAGYSTTGNPSNLALNKTVKNSLARRIALHRPKPEELEALQEKIDELQERIQALPDKSPCSTEEYALAEKELAKFREELEFKKKRKASIPYIDPLDVRYKNFQESPKPSTQAVMFCLMDVSGSMTEHMKDLAKHFYVLLYIFLRACS